MKNKPLILSNKLSISEALNSFNSTTNVIKGFAIVLDSSNLFFSVVTDGDFRRAFSKGISTESSIEEICSKNPKILLQNSEVKSFKNILKLEVNIPKYLPVINDKRELVDLLTINDINKSYSCDSVTLFGLGFVGLTLAVSLADNGFNVTGIDIDESLVCDLNKGEVRIFEPNLKPKLKIALKNNKIQFNKRLIHPSSNYIICVGTPVNEFNLKPNLDYLNKVCFEIGLILKKNDLIMLRSTVPVGTTRDYVIPKLEEFSNLKAGLDFFVSFCPERTIEGKALEEITNLPQIIGGYSDICLESSIHFWSKISKSIVKSQNLEAAELVKLANNTFRDLSFAFSNQLAMISSKYNVDSKELIESANNGYPRNQISLPSPGVGGYCLTKDPYLYSTNIFGEETPDSLGIISRKINNKMLGFSLKYIKDFKRNNPSKSHKFLIAGLAFKGVPKTNDFRGSISLHIFENLSKLYPNDVFHAFDSVIKGDIILDIGFSKSIDIDVVDVNDYDLLLILNNSEDHKKFEKSLLKVRNKNIFIFDGWSILDKKLILSKPNLKYCNLGYCSDE